MSQLDIFGADLAFEIYKDKNLEKQKKEADPHYTCKEQIKEGKNRLSDLKEKIGKKEEHMQKREECIVKLKDLYDNLCHNVTEKQKQTDKDYHDWVDIDNQYKQYVKQLHEYIKKLKKLNITLNMKQKQMNVNNNHPTNESENVEYLENELQELKTKNESINNALNTVKHNSQNQNNNIKQQLIETLKLLNDIQIEYQSLKQENETLKTQQNYDNQTEENEINTLKEEINSLKKQLVVNDQLQETQAMEALQQQVAELRESNSKLTSTHFTLQSEYDKISADNEKLEKEIEILKQQNTEKTQYLKQQKTDNEILEKEMEKEIELQKQQINELETELSHTKATNVENDNLIMKQNNKIQSLKDEIEQFQVLDELQREHIDNYRESSMVKQGQGQLQLVNENEISAEILELTELVSELQNELENEKTLNLENEDEIKQDKTRIQLLSEEIEQLHVLEEMQQAHIKTIRDSGVIDIVMSQSDIENDITELTDTVDLLEEALQREKVMNEQYKNEINVQKNKNEKLKIQIQNIIEAKLKSMELSCKALEQLRNAVKSLQRQKRRGQLQIEKHAWGVLGPLSYHLVDIATMNS